MKPRLLDLFCGAGGCARGYQLAGFEVVGVDIVSQPRYAGDAFVRGDALSPPFRMDSFDAIHASPPCQAYSALAKLHPDRTWPDLIPATRAMLVASGVPYIIENVPGAPLVNPITLCGTMFGLETDDGVQLRRHRLFECPWIFGLLPQCQHVGSAIGVYGGGQHPARRKRRYKAEAEGLDFGVAQRRRAMGIEWMTRDELNQAIPPAYTEWLGRHLMEHVKARAA